MKVNINISPYCKSLIKHWSEIANTTFDKMVDNLLAFAFENEMISPPIKVSNLEEFGKHTIHMQVDINNEDYIATVQAKGRRSISLSRILEYMTTYEGYNETFIDIENADENIKKERSKTKVTLRKFVEEEQTTIMLKRDDVINEAKDLWVDAFIELWPIIKFAKQKFNIKNETIDYIEKILSIK